jgi:hypothetical protein
VAGGVDAIQAAPHDNFTFFDPVALVVATTHGAAAIDTMSVNNRFRARFRATKPRMQT